MVAEEGVDIGAVVQAPGLDRAIEGCTEELVGALAEGQPRHNVPVAREPLCTQPAMRYDFWRFEKQSKIFHSAGACTAYAGNSQLAI